MMVETEIVGSTNAPSQRILNSTYTLRIQTNKASSKRRQISNLGKGAHDGGRVDCRRADAANINDYTCLAIGVFTTNWRDSSTATV